MPAIDINLMSFCDRKMTQTRARGDALFAYTIIESRKQACNLMTGMQSEKEKQNLWKIRAGQNFEQN